ncbi:MAG TPA: hypothetical protein VNL94_06725 [Candidatus Binatia bacterium]|nr:hypothetical protein [Candidatus Binatia bacterium]
MTGQGVPSLRAQLAEARRVGCRVEAVRRTGEVRVWDGCCPPLTINNRRRDGTRELAERIEHSKP